MKQAMVLAGVVLLTLVVAAPANLLVNAGFESGDLTGWVVSDWSANGPDFGAVTENKSQGSYGARCWWDGELSQIVAVTAGLEYLFSADAYVPSGGAGGGMWMNVKWLDASQGDLSTAWETDPAGSTRSQWNTFSSGSIVAQSGAAYAKVSVGAWGATPPNPTDYDRFDLDTAAIPEPTVLGLCGLSAMLLHIRRKLARR